jgi:integrase
VPYTSLLRAVKEIFHLSGFDKSIVRSREVNGIKVVSEHEEWELMGLHRLRASAITSMLQSGLSETEVKSFSGHSLDSKSFKRYVRFSQKHLDEKFDKFQSKF